MSTTGVFDLDSITAIISNKEGLETVIKLPNLLIAIIKCLKNKNSKKHDQVISILINISAEEEGANALINIDEGSGVCIVKNVLDFIFEASDSKLRDNCCKVLCNITHHKNIVNKVIDKLQSADINLDKIASVFVSKNNKDKCELEYLSSVFYNLTQTSRGRMIILDKDSGVLTKLLPYVQYDKSLVCRRGIIGMIRNICFICDAHEWLLSEEIDLLPNLLLPLADNTEFDEEDNDKLPIDLQYLGEDKRREEDPENRCMLLDALTLLCTRRMHRTYIRDKNAYVILRELHKWETDQKALLLCENLVNILIRTEEEIGVEDLQEVEVPPDLQEKFKKFDENCLQDVSPS